MLKCEGMGTQTPTRDAYSMYRQNVQKYIENISKITLQCLDYVKQMSQFFENKNDRDIRANDIPILESEWIQIPLREFGYKCIENKHELCEGCKCLCHFGDGKFRMSILEERYANGKIIKEEFDKMKEDSI